MTNKPIKTLVIIDEEFEKIEGHPYEYDKSVAGIFKEHGFETVIYGRINMLESFKEELNAKPWFAINKKSKVRKIPVLGALLYRTHFWKKLEKEITGIVADAGGEHKNLFLFFPGLYWYNALPVAKALKNINHPAALLYRMSIFDTIRLPSFIRPLTLGLIEYSVRILKKKKNIHYFSDSEVIAEEWQAHFKIPMRVLPIPHLLQNKKNTPLLATDKVRMYLPGGMRMEKGAKLLTEGFEQLAALYPEALSRIVLVTQFLGADPVLDGFKSRLSAVPVEHLFLQHLTSEEYNNELKMADVILIPYHVSEGYRARTSGILAEAIASSKPFITTDGTWMSLQARKFDTGLIVNDNQPKELATAIYNMMNSYGDHLRKADSACRQWVDSQSKDVFFQQLVSATGE